jgi:hypothetical protein
VSFAAVKVLCRHGTSVTEVGHHWDFKGHVPSVPDVSAQDVNTSRKTDALRTEEETRTPFSGVMSVALQGPHVGGGAKTTSNCSTRTRISSGIHASSIRADKYEKTDQRRLC